MKQAERKELPHLQNILVGFLYLVCGGVAWTMGWSGWQVQYAGKQPGINRRRQMPMRLRRALLCKKQGAFLPLKAGVAPARCFYHAHYLSRSGHAPIARPFPPRRLTVRGKETCRREAGRMHHL